MDEKNYKYKTGILSSNTPRDDEKKRSVYPVGNRLKALDIPQCQGPERAYVCDHDSIYFTIGTAQIMPTYKEGDNENNFKVAFQKEFEVLEDAHLTMIEQYIQSRAPTADKCIIWRQLPKITNNPFDNKDRFTITSRLWYG